MILAEENICTGCSACRSICPKSAIALSPDAEGFLQPQIDGTKCIDCGLCRKICPVLSSIEKNSQPPECYGFKTHDRELLRASSSGGAFTSLAQPVIRAGGTVFGCVMTRPDFAARHVAANTEDALAAMRGSKYVQSDIQDSYRQCKAVLERGRRVLFSGTSCQIAGLKKFLGKDYPSLLTVDFICHGVPSPAVWRKYLDWREKEAQSKISCISSRNKNYSWKKFSLALSFDNAKLNSINPLDKDLYFKAFIGNYCLRSCCYACRFKPGKGSVSDITIADFWGVEEVRPEFYDELGVSAVMVHTPKGKAAFTASGSCADVIPVTLGEIELHNPSYSNVVAMPPGRKLFMRHFRHVHSYGPLLKLSARYPVGRWMWAMIKRKIKRLTVKK